MSASEDASGGIARASNLAVGTAMRERSRVRAIFSGSTGQSCLKCACYRDVKRMRGPSTARAAQRWKGLPGRRELLYLNSCDRVKWGPVSTFWGYLIRKEFFHLGSWTTYKNTHLLSVCSVVCVVCLGARNTEVIKSTPSCQVAGKT